MNTIVFDQRTTAKAILISVVAALGGFLFGFDTAVINGAVAAIRSDFALSSGLTGFAVFCALLGSDLGAWFAGRWPPARDGAGDAARRGAVRSARSARACASRYGPSFRGVSWACAWHR